jgi:hypothetical protein
MKDRLAGVLSRMERFRLTRLEPGPFDLGGDWKLEDEDVVATLVEHRPPPLLFSKFSAERVLADMERWGILPHLRQLGYSDLHSEFSGQDLFETRFCLYGSHPLVDRPSILMDIRTHQGELAADSPFDNEEFRLRALILDWISMEDAARPLPPDRVALPGQKHPGLGLFRRAYRMTVGYLRATDFDVVVSIPEYFHNAMLYSRDFKFFMPHRQGRLMAMKRDLLCHGLARVSHALSSDDDRIGQERVESVESGQAVLWTPAEQVMPLTSRLRDYFYDSRYLRAVAQETESNHYRLVEEPAAV